jgi:hypothetical protein
LGEYPIVTRIIIKVSARKRRNLHGVFFSFLMSDGIIFNPKWKILKNKASLVFIIVYRVYFSTFTIPRLGIKMSQRELNVKRERMMHIVGVI